MAEIKLSNSAKEIRQLYNCNHYQWGIWLTPLRKKIPKHAKTYTPKQIRAIIDLLGEPEVKINS